MTGTRRSLRASALAVLVLVMAVAGPAVAAPAIEELVVVPEGAEVVRARDIGVEVPREAASFLDGYEDLAVSTVDVDRAILRERDRGVGGPWVVVTVVRLGSDDEAHEAFAAVHATQPDVRTLGEPSDGVGRRWIDDGTYRVLEAYRVVGPDLVVWAELDATDETGAPLLTRAVEAHLDAFPAGRSFPRGAVLALALALVVAVVASVVVAGARRRPSGTPGPMAVSGTRPSARMNW